jgi:excisionase family DNA binding protein
MLITSPQVAQHLGVSLRTVHRLVADGKLAPAQQLPGPNGAFLFDQSAVEALRVARQAATTSSDAANGAVA